MANCQRRLVMVRMTAAAIAAVVMALPAARAAETVDYDRDIRPILSDKCFACHGPDEAARESGLRLDVRDAALAATDSGEPAIVPGQSDQSPLIARILSTDPSDMMPPPQTNKTLTAAEKELLQRWIAEGAPYAQHWAFVPIERPEAPKASGAGWARNEIDHFIAARLAREGLEPAPEASRETLIRRLTLDLTGLPPTLAEIDAFLSDRSQDAYEKVVDRLLASPRFGERMAVDWLDAARYADTHGYHIDSGRDMTHWRDWVIAAFNNNMPFDQFTVEQLAGDLLPNPTVEQRIASGFNRNHMINFEGGAIPEEYHTAYIIDRVNTLGTVWLGLTVACAQCHDHKYDPISQREYFSLYAFFHNVPEKGLDGIKGNAVPFLRLPTAEQEKEIARLKGEIADAKGRLQADRPDLDAAQRRWEDSFATTESVSWTPVSVMSDGAGITLSEGVESEPQDDQSVFLNGASPAQDAVVIRFPVPAGAPIAALRLEALADDRLSSRGPGRSGNGNFVLTDLRVTGRGTGDAAASRPVKVASAWADFSQNEFPAAHAIDQDPATGWAIYPEVGKTHQATFEFAHPVTTAEAAELAVTLEFRSPYSQHSIGRFRLSHTTAQAVRSPEALPRNVRAALAVSAEQRSDEQREQVRSYFRSKVSEELQPIAARVQTLEGELTKLEEQVPTAMVMEEMPQPRDTFVLMRGEYDKPGEKVTAAVPAALPPLPEGAAQNRLGLAQWLVSPEQPLTARVTVNRYWQMFFGWGLVKTTEDFGTQGALPTHPELLTWLAAEFQRGSETNPEKQAWDLKALVRLIVTSSTYRQASAASPELFERDPQNELLARGPRFRLQAEFIRDQALAVSGLLQGKIGGESVSPYQPAGLWEELMSREDNDRFSAQKYVQSQGADLYRRTMYTFWKRTCPPPTLATFDAPDRETCTVRRARTNTPLQALILLNDPTYVEASRHLAERVIGEGGDADASRLRLAFRLSTGRPPTEREQSVLQRMLDAQRTAYAADRQAAEKLLEVGESGRNESIDASELAAWATICSVILNLDETVTRN